MVPIEKGPIYWKVQKPISEEIIFLKHFYQTFRAWWMDHALKIFINFTQKQTMTMTTKKQRAAFAEAKSLKLYTLARFEPTIFCFVWMRVIQNWSAVFQASLNTGFICSYPSIYLKSSPIGRLYTNVEQISENYRSSPIFCYFFPR
jgi:hypothetical protein